MVVISSSIEIIMRNLVEWNNLAIYLYFLVKLSGNMLHNRKNDLQFKYEDQVKYNS